MRTRAALWRGDNAHHFPNLWTGPCLYLITIIILSTHLQEQLLVFAFQSTRSRSHYGFLILLDINCLIPLTKNCFFLFAEYLFLLFIYLLPTQAVLGCSEGCEHKTWVKRELVRRMNQYYNTARYSSFNACSMVAIS